MDGTTIPIKVLAIMACIGFLGVLAHWFQAALKKQVTWNLFKYLFLEQKGNSTSMIVAYLASMYGLQQLGAFDSIQLEYISEAWKNGDVYKPFVHAAFEAAGAGYLCDSTLNKGAKLEDTKQE